MSGSSDSGTGESDLTISARASDHQLGTDNEADDALSDNSSSCDEEDDHEHYDEDEGEDDEDGEEYDYDADENGDRKRTGKTGRPSNGSSGTRIGETRETTAMAMTTITDTRKVVDHPGVIATPIPMTPPSWPAT